MEFYPCQDSDEIITEQNFTLAKTGEYNEYCDQRQGWISPVFKLVLGRKPDFEGTVKWGK